MYVCILLLLLLLLFVLVLLFCFIFVKNVILSADYLCIQFVVNDLWISHLLHACNCGVTSNASPVAVYACVLSVVGLCITSPNPVVQCCSHGCRVWCSTKLLLQTESHIFTNVCYHVSFL